MYFHLTYWNLIKATRTQRNDLTQVGIVLQLHPHTFSVSIFPYYAILNHLYQLNKVTRHYQHLIAS